MPLLHTAGMQYAYVCNTQVCHLQMSTYTCILLCYSNIIDNIELIYVRHLFFMFHNRFIFTCPDEFASLYILNTKYFCNSLCMHQYSFVSMYVYSNNLFSFSISAMCNLCHLIPRTDVKVIEVHFIRMRYRYIKVY